MLFPTTVGHKRVELVFFLLLNCGRQIDELFDGERRLSPMELCNNRAVTNELECTKIITNRRKLLEDVGKEIGDYSLILSQARLA